MSAEPQTSLTLEQMGLEEEPIPVSEELAALIIEGQADAKAGRFADPAALKKRLEDKIARARQKT